MRVGELIRDLSLFDSNSEVVVETLQHGSGANIWFTVGPVMAVTRTGSDKEVRLTVLVKGENNARSFHV